MRDREGRSGRGQPRMAGAGLRTLRRAGSALRAQWACCICCGDPVGKVPGLCEPCVREMPESSGLCSVCGRVMGALSGWRCRRCDGVDYGFDQVFAPFLFEYPLNAIVRRAKFGRDLAAARVLGDLLTEQLVLRLSKYPLSMVPVPLHRHGLNHRGFNQASVIAERIARTLGLAWRNDLVRKARATEAQAALQDRRSRWRNLAGAFVYTGKPLAEGHVVIIDDVMTTGATAHHLARCLKREAGCSRVDVWAVCRTATGPGDRAARTGSGVQVRDR